VSLENADQMDSLVSLEKKVIEATEDQRVQLEMSDLLELLEIRV